ncbi:nuclear pore complex protein NUP205-like, partial [Phalaenopsis equestris]|uniref:nuclear pore complex protein NUP205-like n=1 Tax=Phalaenopsis equestris TaxID=78828 RepID=UPI0009E1FF2D
VKNKVVREVIDFVKSQRSVFDQILREDISSAEEGTLERINLVVSILSRIWPYEENDEYGFLQGLFSMMIFVFNLDIGSASFGRVSDSVEYKRNSELIVFRLCFSLISYLYLLITKKLIRLQVCYGFVSFKINKNLCLLKQKTILKGHQHPHLFVSLSWKSEY